MRLAWAIVAGLALGIGVAWWLARQAPGESEARQRRAARAAAQAQDAKPSLYRWRDAAGVLQITDQPPPDRPFQRINREPDRAIKIKGDSAD